MNWLDVLRREVEKKGAEQVARELGIGHSTVMLVLSGKYNAKPDRIRRRVEKIYGADGMVHCPVLGTITPDACARNWNRAKRIGMRAGNPETLKLYKACLKCDLRRV